MVKSDVFKLKGDDDSVNIASVLSEVERTAQYAKLSDKQAMHLRFLAEELIGLQKGLLGFSVGEMYVENEGKKFKLCLHADVHLDEWDKERMIEASSTKKNDAYKGIKGKILLAIDAMLADPGAMSETLPIGMYECAATSHMGGLGYEQAWMLSNYRDGLDEQDTENWDMLEQSVLSSLADDIAVAARNNYVDIVIVKSFE